MYLCLGFLCFVVTYTFTIMLLLSGFFLLCCNLYLYLNVNEPGISLLCGIQYLNLNDTCRFYLTVPVPWFSLLCATLYLYINVTCLLGFFFCFLFTYTVSLMLLFLGFHCCEVTSTLTLLLPISSFCLSCSTP